MSAIPFHPLADLFPLIEGEEFARLVVDVAENGLLEPIVLHQGSILDGRNRFRACEAAGSVPLFTVFGFPSFVEASVEVIDACLARRPLTPREMEWLPGALAHLPATFPVDGVPGADPLAFVLSKNLARRHLSESQRAMVAAKIATMRRGERTDLAPIGAKSDAQAAELLNVGERSVERAKTVQREGVPELGEAVERGEVSVTAAAELARQPEPVQREIVARGPAEIRAAAKQLRIESTEAKRARRAEREAALGEKIAAANADLADRIEGGERYGVILADPEWKFETWSEAGQDRAAENHYPTSPLDAIAARPVADLAAKDCVLFLWARQDMLPQALAVMAAWGFAYKSGAVWRKPVAGTGYWFRFRHELLLVGTRGAPPAPAPGQQIDSVFEAPRGLHSEKPDLLAEWIERIWPSLPKIELNARRARPGWAAWGAEAPEPALPVDEYGMVQVDPTHRVPAAYITAEERAEIVARGLSGTTPAPAPRIGSGAGSPRKGEGSADDDPLEIPDFLRRTARPGMGGLPA